MINTHTDRGRLVIAIYIMKNRSEKAYQSAFSQFQMKRGIYLMSYAII